MQIQESWKLLQWFLGRCYQKWAWLSSLWDCKICYVLRMSLCIEQIFCMLTVIKNFLVRSTSFSALIFPSIIAHPSVFPFSRLSRHFLGIASLVFSKLWHGARNSYEVVCGRTEFSWKTFFPQKLRKWTKKGPKTRFFEFIEKFRWICSIMKIRIIWCVPAQTPYLVKSCSSNMGQNALSQSDCRIF